MRAVLPEAGLFLVALALCSGQLSCGHSCTADFRLGLSVSVVDRVTGAPICDAIVAGRESSTPGIVVTRDECHVVQHAVRLEL
jgi:hypothetical protein